MYPTSIVLLISDARPIALRRTWSSSKRACKLEYHRHFLPLSLMMPEEESGPKVLVVGERSSGKTTLVKTSLN
jgi:polynucleotide 5'-kinase involved in rRNA processing